MREIYFDTAATTPVRPEALSAFISACETVWGNPSSLHTMGFKAEQLVAASRKTLSAALGGEGGDVIFTPSGTFADNLAILGAARKNARNGKHIIVSAIEHEAVLNAVGQLESEGFEITRVRPGPNGKIDPGNVLAALRQDTVLVSCMLANNELGTLQPVGEIAWGIKRLRSAALLHTDAVQAFKKTPFSATELGVDLLSVSGHKIGAPKGIGALWIKKGVKLSPLTYGGGQESGLCPGTEPVPLITAFATAAKARYDTAETDRLAAEAVRLLSEVEGLQVICRGELPVVTVSMPGYRSETLVHYLAQRGIYVSAGSACGRGKPSHVLQALGLPDSVIAGALRISISNSNNLEHIGALRDALSEAAVALAHN